MATDCNNGCLEIADMIVTKVYCDTSRSALHNASLIREIGRHLCLDDLKVLIIWQDPDETLDVMNVTDTICSAKSLGSSVAFIEAQTKTLGMFEIYGTWNETTDILILHVNGSDKISIIAPRETTSVTMERIANEVRKIVKHSERAIF